MREEIIATALIESLSDPVQPSKIRKIKHDMGLWTVKFYTGLQDFDIRNRNGRKYLHEAMIPALTTVELKELMAAKAWLGEYGHPVGKNVDITRIANIEPGRASHRILDLDISNSSVSGWVETLPKGLGEEFGSNILIGMEPAFSLRALAKVMRRNDGSQIINTKPRVITYDAVILPSHKFAYRDKSKGKTIVDADGCELVNESLSYNDASFQIMQESLMDFIAMESTNIKLVSNQNEIILEGMGLSEDRKHAIIKDGDITYSVKLEDEIKHIITEAFSKF